MYVVNTIPDGTIGMQPYHDLKLSQPCPVQFKTGATRYSVGTPHPPTHPTHTNSPKLKKDYTGSHIHALG